MSTRYLLDPSDDLDFAFDWTPWLANGETISSHTVTVTSGATMHSESQAAGVVTFWLTAGVAGSEVTCTCRITTSAGRTTERSFGVSVRDR